MKQSEPAEILVIDDEREVANVLTSFLKQSGFNVISSEDSEEAFGLIEKNSFDIVVTDIRMPGVDGIDILKKVKKTSFETEVIIITGFGTKDNAIAALKEGASDFLLKPFDMEDILIAVQKVLRLGKLRRENIRFRERIEHIDSEYAEHMGADTFIGASDAVKEVHRLIDMAAEAPDSGVLITGESGTGKELVSSCIHRKSARSGEPFIAVNCSGFPAGLIESELFGHVKGAFTGAEQEKKGVVELAHRGTLLLDEIGDMPRELQGRLLRVLEDRKVRKVGGQKYTPVDFRVISVTNKDLDRLVSEGEFRKDLFFRLNIMHIEVPPLRGRKEDIELLTAHYVDIYSKKLRKKVETVSREVMVELREYRFPGNVRELKNMIEQAVILSKDTVLPLECFPRLCMAGQHDSASNKPSASAYSDSGDTSREAILAGLERNRWHMGKTAEDLGIGYDALRYRMDKYDIKK